MARHGIWLFHRKPRKATCLKCELWNMRTSLTSICFSGFLSLKGFVFPEEKQTRSLGLEAGQTPDRMLGGEATFSPQDALLLEANARVMAAFREFLKIEAINSSINLVTNYTSIYGVSMRGRVGDTLVCFEEDTNIIHTKAWAIWYLKIETS